MKAVTQAAQAIMLGDAEIVVAGGMENMSLIPHYVHMRNGVKFGPTSMVDGMQKDGFRMPMTITPWEYVLIFAPQNTTLPRAAGCICDSVLRAFGQSLGSGQV
jgi:acetyl-CoA acetyltransferase